MSFVSLTEGLRFRTREEEGFLELQQSVLQRYGPAVDHAIRSGSTDELESMLGRYMPVDGEERITSMLPLMVRMFRQADMQARADLLHQLWLKMSLRRTLREITEHGRKPFVRDRSNEAFRDRFLMVRFEYPEPDHAAVLGKMMKSMRLEPSAHTDAVAASPLTLRQKISALSSPELFASMLKLHAEENAAPASPGS
jgi:hypothetical protein